jgi:cytochrome P450
VTAFNQITMRVIVRALFGSSLSGAEMNQVGRAMGHALDYMVKGMVLNAVPEAVPLPGKRRFMQSIATFDATVYKLIDECRAGRAGDDHLLAMLLGSVDEETGEQMSDTQLRDEVATLFLAGYETTSIALTWATAALNRNPAISDRLDDEIGTVLEGRRPTFDDVGALGYTRRVFEETLRLHPPAWFVPRMAIDDDEFDGHLIPAGANVIPLVYLIHRNPEHWPDPGTFDPDRFESEQAAARHTHAYLPFGAGKRLCIGRSFALLEGPLVLAMVRQRFEVRMADEAVRPMLSTTLRPKGRMTATVEARR